VNPAGADSALAVPDRFRIRGFPDGIEVKDLSPGIARIDHLTHRPMAVLQGDSIILLEAPVGDQYVRMVLDSLRSHFPGKPVRAFVVTHHHWDHTSGVRAAFAAGLRAIVHADNTEFIRTLGGAHATPARARAITSVRDSMIVGTGPTRFTLYHIPTGHARGLMMAYFPETKLMFEVDLAQGSPNDRQDLYDFITGHRIEVASFARIHGPLIAWDAFVKTVPTTH
jgi:glyoxylase-like metal-dependent hydrolase (beta-lactamase superfamily II)